LTETLTTPDTAEPLRGEMIAAVGFAVGVAVGGTMVGVEVIVAVAVRVAVGVAVGVTTGVAVVVGPLVGVGELSTSIFMTSKGPAVPTNVSFLS
jgi:hypothetical protein